MSLDPIELLQQLIQIPSVNPMGRDIRGPQFGEQRLTDFLQFQCERLGLQWLRHRVHPGRDNLLALFRGNPPVHQGGEFLLWDVHQDTVPVDGMTVEPFGGEVRDGRVYGRGACDVKGSMAAMLAAVSRLVFTAMPPRTFPTLVIAFTVNEECGFTGASALSKLWLPTERSGPWAPPERWSAPDADSTHGAEDGPAHPIISGTISPEELFPRPPDAAIVAEPTEFQAVVAHQGVLRWRCHTIGRAAHTSRPDAGINAIYAMSQVVRAVERCHQELQQKGLLHPLCGRPTTCVSTIHGGVGVNTVPERATIEIDRRLGPDELPEKAYDELVRYITEHADVGQSRIKHDPPFMQSSGLSDQQNRSLAQCLAKLAREHGRDSDLVGVPYATDAAAIAATCAPTVVFGPGSINQAHTADEFIAIEELRLATEIFHQIVRDGLGIHPSG